MEEKKYTVYMHINKTNNKVYIGITSKSVEERWGRNGYHYKRNRHFWGAIQKYGWDNFEHKILYEGISKSEACQKEIELIAIYDSTNPQNGYNISAGGEFGYYGVHHSEETRKKQSKARKGKYCGENNPMYGVSPKDRMNEETYNNWKQQIQDRMSSAENKEKLRRANIGKKYSDEVNAKKGLKGVDHSRYDKPLSQETKEKISKAHTGMKYSDEVNKKKGSSGASNPSSRSVYQFDKNGNFIRSWSYMTLASNALNISLSRIAACCQGRQKNPGGYMWEYSYDIEVVV